MNGRQTRDFKTLGALPDGKITTTMIVTVFGATGTQGTTVCEALLKDGTFIVRGVTRYPTSEKALQLAQKGIHIFKADLDDVESLKAITHGSHVVYGVTNFWDPVSRS